MDTLHALGRVTQSANVDGAQTIGYIALAIAAWFLARFVESVRQLEGRVGGHGERLVRIEEHLGLKERRGADNAN